MRLKKRIDRKDVIRYVITVLTVIITSFILWQLAYKKGISDRDNWYMERFKQNYFIKI